eukprot:5276107-Pleurochrysis_carterae.AAC.1
MADANGVINISQMTSDRLCGSVMSSWVRGKSLKLTHAAGIRSGSSRSISSASSLADASSA